MIPSLASAVRWGSGLLCLQHEMVSFFMSNSLGVSTSAINSGHTMMALAVYTASFSLCILHLIMICKKKVEFNPRDWSLRSPLLLTEEPGYWAFDTKLCDSSSRIYLAWAPLTLIRSTLRWHVHCRLLFLDCASSTSWCPVKKRFNLLWLIPSLASAARWESGLLCLWLEIGLFFVSNLLVMITSGIIVGHTRMALAV
jgi:hypothetical protein